MPAPFVLVVLLFGLLLARIATFATLSVALPVVLVVLSLVFGSALRRAADQVRRAGTDADGSLREFGRWLRGADVAPPGHQSPQSADPVGARPRHRVSEAPSSTSSDADQEARGEERVVADGPRRTAQHRNE
jgi:hypothetical protein